MSVDSNGHRALVVDDEPNIVDVVTMALKFQGFAVESAGTGAQALAVVAAFHPHLIVLDVMLPDMEGFDVAQRLGAPARTRADHLPDGARRHRGQDPRVSLGGDDYVTKPFSLEELVARIRSILRRTGEGRERRSPVAWCSRTVELDEDAHEVRRAGDIVDLPRPSTACCAT